MSDKYMPLDTKADDKMFGPLALGVQIVLCCSFYSMDYDFTSMKDTDSSSVYNFYVGVALMMFVGFGYLMTFLKSYGLGAVGFTMFLTCLGVQFAMVVENFFATGSGKATLDFMDLLNGNFAIAAVLISFGGLIGKISPTQCLVLCVLELTFYCANKIYVLTNYFAIADCGGTIIIHVFGAYFGLAASAVLGAAKNEDLNASSYNSDLFSLIGTVFLWLFWPSFVAGGLPAGTEGHSIALLNTVFALLASTVTTFAIMPMIQDPKNRLGTVPVQNATLAGGVTIGATANLAMGPFGACLIGILAGALSTIGFCKPLIKSAVDTCGINNLHGMPGILGGLISGIIPMLMKDTGVVVANQFLGLAATLLVASTTGAATGFILKMMGSPPAPFNDVTYWDCADDIPKAA